MMFVDQAWTQIDVSERAPREDVSGSRMPVGVAQPTLHVFSPRMRILVQCARLHARLPVAHLALMMNVPPSELIAIEQGHRFPSTRTLDLLQSILKVRLLPDSVHEA